VEKDGQAVLKFAIAYGFRNIQNIVQKIKRGRLAYQYVEIMACPSGTSFALLSHLAFLHLNLCRPYASCTSLPVIFLCSLFSGCLNGGGQIRPEEQESPKELLNRVKEIYENMPARLPFDQNEVEDLYTNWLGGADSNKAKKTLHTQYHEVEKINTALNIKW
jgi:iron only hydrogenase large subunit-like protein